MSRAPSARVAANQTSLISAGHSAFSGQSELADWYDDLVGLAYTGINETKPWQSFVECLREVTHRRDASVMIAAGQNHDKALMITSDHSPHLTPEYFARVMATDALRCFNELPLPKATTYDEALSSQRWTDTAFYRDYMQPFHINNGLLVDVWRDPLLLVRLSVDCSADQSGFCSNERALLERLARHLAKALNLHAELRQTQASCQFYQSAMDQLNIGVLFVNSEGQLVDANQTGGHLLERREGLYLKDGRIAVSAGRSGAQFRTLLRNVLGGDGFAPQGMRLLDDNGVPLLEVVGRRLPHGDALDPRAPAAVLITMACQQAHSVNNQGEPQAQLLRELYGFTACEAGLAKLLVQGYSVQEAAGQLCISINTAKTHLRRIFEKTGYNKQSQVVAFLNSSPSRLM